jgi:hypothetical protein
VTSELQTQERTDAQNCTPWIGVGAAWPWAKPRETWLEAGYQHWEFAGTFREEALVSGDTILVPVIDPITLDQFSARFGVDQWFWQPNRVVRVGRRRPRRRHRVDAGARAPWRRTCC